MHIVHTGTILVRSSVCLSVRPSVRPPVRRHEPRFNGKRRGEAADSISFRFERELVSGIFVIRAVASRIIRARARNSQAAPLLSSPSSRVEIQIPRLTRDTHISGDITKEHVGSTFFLSCVFCVVENLGKFYLRILDVSVATRGGAKIRGNTCGCVDGIGQRSVAIGANLPRRYY